MKTTFLKWIKTSPFALTLAVTCVAVSIISGTVSQRLSWPIVARWGFQVQDLADGQWYSILTTLFFAHGAGGLLLVVVVCLSLVWLAEVTIGTWRTIAFFLTTQILSCLLFAGVLGLGQLLGLQWFEGMERASLLGPVGAAAGVLMAASRVISLMWRRRVRSITISVAVMLALYLGHAQNVYVLFAALIGLALGTVFLRAASSTLTTRSTSREVRANLAIVVAVFAAGPLLAVMTKLPVGPFAVVRNLLLAPMPAKAFTREHCQNLGPGCENLVQTIGLYGHGSKMLSLVPVILLLACAEGIRRGNKLALWIGAGVQVLLALASAFYMQIFAIIGVGLRRGHRVLEIEGTLFELLPMVIVPLCIAALLIFFRRHFSVDSDPEQRRRAFKAFPLMLAIFLGTYTLFWFVEGNANGKLGWGGLVVSLPKLLLPYPFPFSYTEAVYPHGLVTTFLFAFGGGAFWLLWIGLVAALFMSRHGTLATKSDKPRAEWLIRQGGGSLAWMALWPNNSYWFNSPKTAGIAYQEHSGVAVTVGGPFGQPEDFSSAAVEFLEYCAEKSLVPCFYSVTEELVEPLRARGFRSAQVASETILDIETMEFKGKEWQNVRTALNKANKLEVTSVWTRFSQLSVQQRTQIFEMSEDWVSGKALPEMGFTLGGVEELADDAVELCLAVDDDGKIHGITSWLPVFTAGEQTSATLDFMRRANDSFNGVMEFLIAQAVLHFKGRFTSISLSGSPLSLEVEKANDHPADLPSHDPFAGIENESMKRILALLAKNLEPVYGFASLANFKRRFQPRHKKWLMMYQDPMSLPAIALAVGEAYMPNTSVRQMASLLGNREAKSPASKNKLGKIQSEKSKTTADSGKQ